MSLVTQRADCPANKSGRVSSLRRLFGTIEVWVGLSLSFTLLVRLSDDAGGSNLWMLDPLLSIIFLLLKWGNQRFHLRSRFSLSPRWSVALFLIIGWLGSMAYELSISENGGSYGGMHAKTIPSFILAQGSYVPMLLWGLWLVRCYGLTFRDFFFVAGMTCFYEAAFFGIPMMLSPLFFLGPMILAYYFVTYSRFLSMSLLLIDERQLWREHVREISFIRKLAHGTLMGMGCWIIFALWGEAMLYLFNDFEAYP